MRLVADIGGTNTRVALSQGGIIAPQTAQSFSNDDWGHFYDILAAYLEGLLPVKINDVVVALAGPVRGTSAILTNRNWAINIEDLKRIASCSAAVLLNDLTALGYASSILVKDQLKQIYKRTIQQSAGGQSLVVGIGTGFNASPIIIKSNSVQCLTIEAGHISTPVSILKMINPFGDHADIFPTIETLFSGRGFTAFCRLMCENEALEGIDAIKSYDKLGSTIMTSAVNQYSALLGQLLRELSLAYMPNAGIYLAGSVARAVTNVAPKQCAELFAQPCNIRSDSTTDLFVITDDQAALSGCATFGC